MLLVKGRRQAEARLRVVPHGLELRVLADGELRLSQVFRDHQHGELQRAAAAYRDDFMPLGWRETQTVD